MINNQSTITTSHRLQIGRRVLKYLWGLLLGGIFLFCSFEYLNFSPSPISPSAVKTIGDSTTIHFQYLHKNIIVQAYIKNKGPFNFLLDSGVYPSVISPETAHQLDIPIGPKAGNVLGFGNGNFGYSNTTLEKIKVGNLTLKAIAGIIAEQAHLQQVGLPLAGILGHSFFENFITRIDYQNQTIQLFQKLPEDFLKGKEVGKDYIQFPLVLSGGKIPIIQHLEVKGKKITTWLDTGFAGELVLTKSTARALGLQDIMKNGKAAQATGTRGNFDLRYGIVDEVRIDAFSQDSVNTFIFSQGGNDILGNVFFENYILTFDYLNEQVYLEKQ